MGCFAAAKPPWSGDWGRAQRCTEVGSVATGADTFTFLMIHYLGKRFLEAFIFILIMVSGSQIPVDSKTLRFARFDLCIYLSPGPLVVHCQG